MKGTLPESMAEIHLQLGPFQGITDVYFRQEYHSFFTGIDRTFTPFFSGIHTENSRNLRGSEIDPALNPTEALCPQLLSNDGDEILRFASQCAALGYEEVNLNMGCPYPQVARKKRGSGLLPYTEKVALIAEILRHETGLKLSIKCRLGYHEGTEIDRLLPIFNSLNLTELIIHARLGKQMYSGIPDKEKFAQLIPKVSCPVVYNGDIFSRGDFLENQRLFPQINRWMLGRGLLADPFLAADIKQQCTLEASERKEQVYRFITSLYLRRRKAKNDNPAILGRMKELWSYLHLSFSEPAEAWRSIRRASSFDDYEEAEANIFRNQQWKGEGFRGDCDPA